MAAILIIEDELVLAHELSLALESAGHEVAVGPTAAEGLAQASAIRPDLVLLDLRLPDRSGLDIIADLLALDASMLIVLMTAYGSTREAVEAMRRGAVDYLHKPLDVAELRLSIDRLLRAQRQRRELEWLRNGGSGTRAETGPEPAALRYVYAEVARLCDASLPAGRRPPILLSGPVGAAMDLVAREIHRRLGGGPFLEVTCGSMPPAELEKALFGSEADAASGAGSSTGLAEAASRGTLLLRRISELDDGLQARLLDLLERRKVRRVGSSRQRDVDVHVIATSHRDLAKETGEGRFRAELLHRVRGLSFELPPVREYGSDLVPIAREIARELGCELDGRPRTLTEDAEQHLLRYAWPGDLRELRNVVERAVLLSETTTLSESIVASLLERAAEPGHVVLPERGVRLDDVERELMRQALERAGGNQTRASALLGLSRDTFRYRMSKWGLEANEDSR